ncbi:MAG: hypothetical protein EOP04_24050 [Proteobacteria bacterium]|nr:MAG: hypothetical protein EOP04_24050 [Pseudomonadota bacterium]
MLLPDYVNTIHAAIERFGPVDYYIAHSFGGLALMHALETIPDDEIGKIALIAPATETTSAVDRFFRIFKLNDTVRAHFDELVIKRGGAETAHYSIRRAINHTKASILWIHDETDKVTPLEDALKVQEDGHLHLEFIKTTGLGHRRIYKDEVVIKKVLEFLNS